MGNTQENIVPAVNQNSKSVYITEGTGIRIMFVGNSITKHEPKESIGWTNNCGMAASDETRDYVHLVMKKVYEYDKNASFCIAQVADYERGFYTLDPAEKYKEACLYGADIIIMFFGANVDKGYDIDPHPPKTFFEAYKNIRNVLNPDNKAKVFHSNGYYIRPKLDAEKEAVSKDCGDTFMDIDDIRSDAASRGRYNHPGDYGMQCIADRFWSFIEPTVKELTEK